MGNFDKWHPVFFPYILQGKRCRRIKIGEAVRQRIIQICQERDISINALSIKSGVTQSTVQNIVSGRNHSTTVATIQKLCDGLGMTITEFFQSDLFSNIEQEVK